MKKALSLVLALLLCLSLGACGGNDKNNEGQEVVNQQTNNPTEDMTTTASNINAAYVGEWKANIKSSDEYYVYTITLNADGSASYRQKYDGTWEYSQEDNWIVLKTVAGNIILNIAEEDGNTVLKYFSDTYYRADEFTENAPKQEEVIQITEDNWQNYFEVKLAAKITKDDFGEMKNGFADNYIYIKKEYRERLASANVAFGWYVSGYGYCTFTHDLETGAISYSDYVSMSTGTPKQDEDGTCSYVFGDDMQKYYVKISAMGGTTTDTFAVDGTTATWGGYIWANVDITKVQGSIILSEE